METSIEKIRAARRELDDVIEEIRALPEHRDFLAAPSFADVAKVATTDHPMVYFAAADAGGLALVVRGQQVTHVQLDELTADAVHLRVAGHLETYHAYRRSRDARADWRRSLNEVTAWLWQAAVGPVVKELGSVTRAVFVPGGLLGLLPLHAAWIADDKQPGRRRYAIDTLTITYVPNARALAAARKLATHPAERLVTVVDPPHLPVQPRLPFASVEAHLAAGAFAQPSAPVEPATTERVLAAIADADVAHLACHGFAELERPLDSGLLLAGREVLRLSDLLTLRSELRLAVLSACETSMPGTELPDEVVALPTGLLQAGVGGVLASLWAVPDSSTALLMADFYRAWRREGLGPADALRAAQLWLRDTSNTEKLRQLGTWVDKGWLPAEPGEELLEAMFERGVEDDSHIQAWAGFAYVGA